MKWIDGILAPYLEARQVEVTLIVMLDSVQIIEYVEARAYQFPGDV